MHLKRILSFLILGVFVAALAAGCTGSTDVQVAKAPEPTPAPPRELPKDPKKGGGTASSGNMKRNPAADPLAR